MFFFFRGQQRRFTFTPKNNLINFYLLTTILQVVLQYDVQYSLLATAKRVNQVTNRVMSPGTIVNRTSRRIDRFRAGRPRIKIYPLQCWKGLSNRWP